jgi:adenylate cyclase
MSLRHLDCAVMFVDMRGFTRASEQLGTDGVVALLEGYFSLVVEVTARRGGRACNMAGDGVVVAFGLAPSAEDPCRAAVLAARALLDAWRLAATDWHDRHGVITGLGVGIHYGPVIAGPIGPPTFRHETVVGDTVNVASRLCQRARAGEALFSDTVRAALGPDGLGLEILALPALQIRGRDLPLGMHCLPARERLDLGAD